MSLENWAAILRRCHSVDGPSVTVVLRPGAGVRAAGVGGPLSVARARLTACRFPRSVAVRGTGRTEVRRSCSA